MTSRFLHPIRNRILAVGMIWLVARVSVGGATETRQPNILWLIGENLTHDLGVYGATEVRTPHLDALAAQGVRFTRVFATNPTCAPSRSAFFTGMYQTTTDTHHMRSHRDDDFRLPPGVRPITHRLRDAGYFTANIKTIDARAVARGNSI
jgi:N-sulfoglucosamine sulfohydrolase